MYSCPVILIVIVPCDFHSIPNEDESLLGYVSVFIHN